MRTNYFLLLDYQLLLYTNVQYLETKSPHPSPPITVSLHGPSHYPLALQQEEYGRRCCDPSDGVKDGREMCFKVLKPLGMTRSLYILITETIPFILSICGPTSECPLFESNLLISLPFYPWRRHHCNAGWTWKDSAVLDELGIYITAVLEGFTWQGASGNLWKHSPNISFTHWFGATGPTSECPWGGEAPPLHLN